MDQQVSFLICVKIWKLTRLSQLEVDHILCDAYTFAAR